MNAAHDMTVAEMNAAKSKPAPLADCRIVGRTWYRWHEGRQEWFRLSPASVKKLRAEHAAREERAAFERMSLTMPWQMFVCTYVAAKTVKVAHAGYSVRQIGTDDAWELTFGGAPLYPPMTARIAYSWFERLPLVTLSREADEIRMRAYLRAA